MELSNRLATAQLTLGGGESTGTGGHEGQRSNQRGGKGGNRPRQDRAQAEEARA